MVNTENQINYVVAQVGEAIHSQKRKQVFELTVYFLLSGLYYHSYVYTTYQSGLLVYKEDSEYC